MNNLNIIHELDVFGNRIMINDKNSFFIKNFHIEQPLSEFIKKFVKKGDNVIELGSNIGYYTTLIAKLVGNEGKVFAFEPYSTNFEMLKHNVELNNHKNVIMIQKAVLDVNDKVILYVCRYDNRNNSMYCTYSMKTDETIEVDTVYIDDYFKDYNENISFIKMDIQGAEFKAINGMKSLIQKTKNLILLTEIWPEGLTKSGTSAKEFIELLLNNGFKLYDINMKPINVVEMSKGEFLYDDIVGVKG